MAITGWSAGSSDSAISRRRSPGTVGLVTRTGVGAASSFWRIQPSQAIT